MGRCGRNAEGIWFGIATPPFLEGLAWYADNAGLLIVTGHERRRRGGSSEVSGQESKIELKKRAAAGARLPRLQDVSTIAIHTHARTHARTYAHAAPSLVLCRHNRLD